MKSIKLILYFNDDENPLQIVERLESSYEKEHYEFPKLEYENEEAVRKEYGNKPV